MSRMRLKEKHPAMLAFQELCNKAEDLGISMEFLDGNAFITIGDETYELQDIEYDNYPMTNFPPTLEFKLTYEKKE